MLLIVTYRADDLHRRHPLKSLLAELERGDASWIRLAGLARPDVAELVAKTAGAAAVQSVSLLFDRTAGNPFFIEELLAASTPVISLPEGLRELLLARLHDLPDSALAVLRPASVLGQGFTEDLLGAATGLPLPETEDALRQAVDHNILRATAGTLRFRHDLMREAIYDDLLPAQRHRLHVAAATAIEADETIIDPPGARWGVLALHWKSAGDRARALGASIQAARWASLVGAPSEAADHLETALTLWEQTPPESHPDGTDRAALLEQATEARLSAGQALRARARMLPLSTQEARGIMDDMLTTDYDGCGRCLVAVRRLSRKSDASSSPQRQADQDLQATADVGGHIIAWADDWEVSGATDPLTRRGLGPWLRGEMGPYDGLVGPSVDRIGRNVRDTLNTQAMLTEQGRIIVTADHLGVWDFSDPNQENEWLAKAWGSQMELRAIQKRNRDEAVRARKAGEPKQRPSYGYMYVRLAPMAKVDHVALDPVGAEIIREVARRILADETGKVTVGTEAVRLMRAGIPTPDDRRAQLYGRAMKGGTWTGHGLKHILCSEAALGYLMHGGRPVIGTDGRPVRLAEPLWDRATRDALISKTAPKRPGWRAPKGMRLLTGTIFCGNCGSRVHVTGRGRAKHEEGPGSTRYGYECTARIRGIVASADCRPAPAMEMEAADTLVGEWFLARYGSGEVMRKIYDPGTGHAAQIADLEATRKRLREDRQAGLYDSADDAEWFRTEYKRLGDEIGELKALPERKPGLRMMPTGRTIVQEWNDADNARRREMLAEFEVRVVLHPTGHQPRVAITGMEISPDGFEMVG